MGPKLPLKDFKLNVWGRLIVEVGAVIEVKLPLQNFKAKVGVGL